jgi:hypothetical protein
MKNLFKKFAVISTLIIVSFSSCEKDESPPTVSPDIFTGIQISGVATTKTDITINGLIGKSNFPNEVIPKVVIYKQDKDDKKVALYTYENVALNNGTSALNTKLVGPYVKDANVVYSFSKTLTLAELGTGVKTTKATTVTIELYDATKKVLDVEMKTGDWGVKLLQ